jgi:hypothetical protein
LPPDRSGRARRGVDVAVVVLRVRQNRRGNGRVGSRPLRHKNSDLRHGRARPCWVRQSWPAGPIDPQCCRRGDAVHSWRSRNEDKRPEPLRVADCPFILRSGRATLRSTWAAVEACRSDGLLVWRRMWVVVRFAQSVLGGKSQCSCGYRSRCRERPTTSRAACRVGEQVCVRVKRIAAPDRPGCSYGRGSRTCAAGGCGDGT